MSFDPDNLVLTDVGLAYLVAQKAANQPAQIGFFRLGDTNLFTPNPSMTDIAGKLVFTGNAFDNEIWWNKYNEQEVIFRCVLDSTKGDFLIGNIGIFSPSGVLIFIAKFNYVHHKMGSLTTGAGGRWTPQFRLIQDDLFERWDFTNLYERFADAPTHHIADAPQYPFESLYTEIRLNDSLLPTNREGYLILSGDTARRWYASPLQESMANVDVFDRYELDGGETGDSHTGIW